MAMRTFLTAALVALPLWVAISTPAHACTCLPTTVAERAGRADLVVLGTVEAIDPIGDPPPQDEYDDRSMRVTMRVDEYLKGAGPDRIVHIEGAGGGAMCQVGSEVGTAYVLFLGPPDNEGQYATSICAGSTVASDDYVAQIRAALQSPDGFPNVGTGPPGHDASRLPLLVATSAIAALGLLSLGLATAIKRRT